MTTALYESETREADDGTTVPVEGIWTPEGEDAADNGFVVYRGLYVAGIGAPNDDAEPGAIPSTAMRHPAAPAVAAGLPDPDHGELPAAWAL